MEINVQSLVESIGIVSVLVWIIAGLNKQIKTISKTVEAQSKTLETMEKRIIETEKIGELYKNLFKEIPEAIEQYKLLIQKTKDATIEELEKAREKQDKELEKLREKMLRRIETEERFATHVVSGDSNSININVGGNINIGPSGSEETKILQLVDFLHQIMRKAEAQGQTDLSNRMMESIYMLKESVGDDRSLRQIAPEVSKVVEHAAISGVVVENGEIEKAIEICHVISEKQ